MFVQVLLLGPMQHILLVIDGTMETEVDAIFVSPNRRSPSVESIEIYMLFGSEESLNIKDKLVYFALLDEVSSAPLAIEKGSPCWLIVPTSVAGCPLWEKILKGKCLRPASGNIIALTSSAMTEAGTSKYAKTWLFFVGGSCLR